MHANTETRDAWVPRFARRLRELDDQVDGETALHLANEAYAESGDDVPEQAAEQFCLDRTPAYAKHMRLE